LGQQTSSAAVQSAIPSVVGMGSFFPQTTGTKKYQHPKEQQLKGRKYYVYSIFV
jgi:hypothetical protein